jgi:hypothetical protein
MACLALHRLVELPLLLLLMLPLTQAQLLCSCAQQEARA